MLHKFIGCYGYLNESYSHCTCGWRSELSQSLEIAYELWQEHKDETEINGYE